MKVMPVLTSVEVPMAPSPPSLPSNRVFVMQFRRHPTGAPSSGYDGRVKHLVSGQVVRFHLLEALLAFMMRVLADVQQQAEAP